MGYYLHDIIPCRSKETYEGILETIERIKKDIKLNSVDKNNIDQMENIFKDVIELWDKEG